MEQRKKTNREKIETLLRVINWNRRHYRKIEMPGKDIAYRTDGTIGSYVKFNEIIRDAHTAIDLSQKNQALAKIELDHQLIDKDKIEAFGILPDLHPTNIEVISPNWNADNGVRDVTFNTEKTKQFSVSHASNETADAVVDQICDVVIRSMGHEEIAYKLSQFVILPGNVTIKNVGQLAENIVNQIYDQDATREM